MWMGRWLPGGGEEGDAVRRALQFKRLPFAAAVQAGLVCAGLRCRSCPFAVGLGPSLVPPALGRMAGMASQTYRARLGSTSKKHSCVGLRWPGLQRC
mmetsp:Transcript_60610/g.163423  ORF Transcript_60610/g.163423 Transcript_60610/m.163423 type:complete len:97 (-) Transcript_60610:7-297(-)